MENVEKITILITTRSRENQEMIVSILSHQADFEIIGIEDDEAGAIIKSERLKPDILIMDFIPPGIDGVELAPMIHRRSPETSIILISELNEYEYASRALQAGISGFLLRKEDMNKLAYAVKVIHLGGFYVSADITQKTFGIISLMKQFPGQIVKSDAKQFPLTVTERNIVEDIARGYSDKEIASHLHFSIGTIRNYLSAIKHKTKLKNRIQIVIYSLVTGIISFEHLGFGIDDEKKAIIQHKECKQNKMIA